MNLQALSGLLLTRLLSPVLACAGDDPDAPSITVTASPCNGWPCANSTTAWPAKSASAPISA